MINGDGESDSQETTADVEFDSAVIGNPARVTATDGLHLRTGASTAHAIILTMPHGATVSALVGAIDRSSGQPAWKQPLHLGIPIVHIITLDSDAAGLVYLAVDVGHETATAPFQI